MKFLLAHQASIEESDKNGRRALHVAAHMGHDQIVELLLEELAKVDAKVQFTMLSFFIFKNRKTNFF